MGFEFVRGLFHPYGILMHVMVYASCTRNWLCRVCREYKDVHGNEVLSERKV